MAGRNGKLLGGMSLAFLVGATLISWWINTFFIYPFLIPGGYTLNLLTVITFSNPLAVILFLIVAGLVWTGYLGATILRSRRR